MVYVGCSGDELQLLDCSDNRTENYHCSHAEDAGVMCTSNYSGQAYICHPYPPSFHEMIFTLVYSMIAIMSFSDAPPLRKGLGFDDIIMSVDVIIGTFSKPPNSQTKPFNVAGYTPGPLY